MQKANSEFDLQVKAMMEAAEVPAPAGAWDAIAARLDAAAVATPPSLPAATGNLWRGGWVWAASFAMAASLALGIFLFTRSGSNSGDEALVAESVNANLLADNTLSKTSSVKSGRRLSINNSESSSYVSLTAGEQQTVETAVEQNVETAAEAKNVEAEGLPVGAGNDGEKVTGNDCEKVTGNDVKSDPFAQMAMEDALKAKKKRSYSAYVDGSFTTNNAGARPGAYGVSAPAEYTQTGVTETSKSSYGIPLSVGAGVRFHLNDRLSIGTGVDYSLLTRTFSGDYLSKSEQVSGDIRHTMQYLGVPVNIYVKLLDLQGFHLYSFAGAEAEYGITNKFTILASEKNTVVGDKCHGMQYSAAVGLGVEFKLGERLGLYIDPSARYYFDCRQPKSIRTEKPFLFMFDAGLRFNL